MVHSMWEQWHHIGIIEGKKTSWISQKQVHIGKVYREGNTCTRTAHLKSTSTSYLPTNKTISRSSYFTSTTITTMSGTQETAHFTKVGHSPGPRAASKINC